MGKRCINAYLNFLSNFQNPYEETQLNLYHPFMTSKTNNSGALRRYVVEFVGTFYLLMSIAMAVSIGLEKFAPIAVAAVLMGMIYAGRHISGAHFNPAVTVAVYLRGKLHAGDILPYLVAQFLGGVLAVMLSGFFLQSMGADEPTPKELDIVPSMIAELLGTIALVYVFLNVITSKATEGNSYFGLAIAITVCGCAYTFSGLSGGAFNPAVALGLTMAGYTSWSFIWVYILANFAGGALAAFLFQFVNGPEL